MVATVVWKTGLLLPWCWLCCLETLCTSRVLWMNHSVDSCHHQVCRNQQSGDDDPATAAQSRKPPLWKGLVFRFVCLCSPFLQIELVPPWGGRIHKTQEADSRLMISVSSSQFLSNNLFSSWFVFMVLWDLYSLLLEIKVTMQISNWLWRLLPQCSFPQTTNQSSDCNRRARAKTL